MISPGSTIGSRSVVHYEKPRKERPWAMCMIHDHLSHGISKYVNIFCIHGRWQSFKIHPIHLWCACNAARSILDPHNSGKRVTSTSVLHEPYLNLRHFMQETYHVSSGVEDPSSYTVIIPKQIHEGIWRPYSNDHPYVPCAKSDNIPQIDLGQP